MLEAQVQRTPASGLEPRRRKDLPRSHLKERRRSPGWPLAPLQLRHLQSSACRRTTRRNSRSPVGMNGIRMARETTMASDSKGLGMPGIQQRNVLIICDDSEFSRQISERWGTYRNAPQFTTSGSSVIEHVDNLSFELAIVGKLSREAVSSVLRALDPLGKPVIFLRKSAEPATDGFARVLSLPPAEAWVEMLISVGTEVLRGVEAVHRAERAEQVNALLRCHATLGQ